MRQITVTQLRTLLNALPPEADNLIVIANRGEYYVTGLEYDGHTCWVADMTPKVNLTCS